MKFRLIAALIAAFAFAACSTIRSTTHGTAISSDASARLLRIEPLLQEEVDNGVRAGFVAAVVDRRGVVYSTAVGSADRERGVPMALDTRFRIASMTKPLVTAALMTLVDEGTVLLSDPVSRFIPSFASPRVATSLEPGRDGKFPTRPASREITIHDLLTHMAGVGYVFDAESELGRRYLQANDLTTEGTLAERIDLIAALPLYEDPGTKWRYSYSIDIIGRVIEVASGMPLGEYMKARLFDPLGMADTQFFTDESAFQRLAVVYHADGDGDLERLQPDIGIGGDPNNKPFGVESGGAGAISSASDYAQFCRMLMNGGAVDGARVLSPASVRLMMENHTPESAAPDEWLRLGLRFGLGGAIIEEPGLFGTAAEKGDWGWSGYWDTYFIVNAERGIAVIVLAQTEPGPDLKPSRSRELVKSIAYGALLR